VGNYSQTIQDTARANHLPLIDLEARTIAFANAHAHDWQNYWLVVTDTAKYPWYATQTAGTPTAPDTTHFQEAGARAVAAMVADGLRETPELSALAKWLKPSGQQ
jgi:lysophospholipase L1-like esterase